MNVDEGITGTPEPGTEEHLASVFESFLSQEEQGTDETPPAQKQAPEPESESAEDESSTEPDNAEKDESEETEETDEESTTEAPQTFRVKVNGEEVEVTLDELQRGYSRTQDYTRKTQELATQRKTAEQEATYMRQGREQLAVYLTELEQAIKDQEPKEPDWVKMQQENPEQFGIEWARWSQYKDRMKALADERQRAHEAVQRDRQQQMESTLAEAREKLVEIIPEWKDPVKAKADKAKMVATAEGYGYTQDDLRQVSDPRIMAVLRDAMLYRELQKKKPAITERIEKVKAATPGSGANRKPKSKATVAKERLAQSGSADDFAALLIEKGLAG